MIALDCEYIAEDAVRGDVPGGRPDVQRTYCEVMQIGACKLDAMGHEIDVLNVTVCAHRIPVIPLWLSRMTGMTEERRALGVSFPVALQMLVDFIGNDKDIWTFNGDWWVLEGNARAHNCSLPFALPFRRAKPLLSEHGVTLERFQKIGFQEICSGGLYRVLDIDLPEIQGVGAHDAAHDARSLAFSVYRLGL